MVSDIVGSRNMSFLYQELKVKLYRFDSTHGTHFPHGGYLLGWVRYIAQAENSKSTELYQPMLCNEDVK